ncbi:MAG: hypothetical protein E6I11_01300 [Chloroflexi bacterium]|nr:MAG: hypothetical protein AUI87_01980 [Actinobacteria bacterium 13_1_40CM_3_66_19]TMF88180.1 MAG: hypothetical protein E6I11_01300 [Chloroflexota bacterium]TMG12734.1 MAG: hypothetical protein E6I00_05785 [Chloroflexota bacterium]
MAYLIAGPLVALVGIVAVFFVMRRKSVEKRSMYSARRSQIEHKVRAARQRTLTPRGHSERPAEETTAAAGAYAPTQVQQSVTYEAPAYEPPPAAAPAAPPARPEQAPAPPPWETTSAPQPASSFDYPAAPAQPAYTPPAPEPFRPAPEPTPMPAPSDQSWTPAPSPAAEPVAKVEPAAPATSGTAAGAWSVVSMDKEPVTQGGGKKKRDGGATGSWQLASGDAPNLDAEEPVARGSTATVMAVAQYAVLVVGLVMVLIGVLVMVANSHVT